MNLGDHLLRILLLPGFVAAFLGGGLLRGLAAWLGAGIGRRPAGRPWQPLAEIVHLAGKQPYPRDRSPALAAWPALFATVALCWGLAMLPWPQLRVGEELSAGLVLYLLCLVTPALARLAAAGLAASVPAALGARRQAPAEIARLLPVLLAGVALSFASGQFTLASYVDSSPWRAIVGIAVAALLLVTLPWPLWDRDTFDAPLAGLGGRVLALYRAVELLELAAQTGLVAVALRSSGLFPPAQAGWPLLVAGIATLLTLVCWEILGLRPLLPETARLYTRWILPVAVVVVLIAWWFGSV